MINASTRGTSRGVVALAAAVGASLAACSPLQAQIGAIPGWRMVWSEEFRGTALNTARWNAENVAWPFNNELQYYHPQQATVSGGILNIKAERRVIGGRNFVAARINTLGKFSQQYGRFEARMKLPPGQGFWPAFWLLPASNGWPPEIDIMEAIGSQPNTVLMTQHFGTVATHQYFGGTFTGPDFTAGYHNFAAEWSPSRIDWFVDGVLRFSTTTNVPQEPMYVVLNLAVGGDLPGSPLPSTVFPQSVLTDWVRVYQRDPGLSNPGYESPLSTTTAVGNWFTFGNAGQSTLSPKSGTKSLRIGGITGAGPYYAGAFQDLPAAPGQVWRATTNARQLTGSALVPGNQIVLKIEWYDSTFTQISSTEVPAISNTSPVDVFVPSVIQATAPVNTAWARLALVMVQTGTGSGTAYFDDTTFAFISPSAASACIPDFDNNTTITVDDIFIFINAWFANDPRANVDATTPLTVDDIFIFINLWFQGCP